MENNRIKMKIGDAEFDAEGPSEIVTAQFNAFIAAIAARSTKAVVPVVDDGGDEVPPNNFMPGTGIPQPILDRVFRKGDTLSLAALPTGDNASADAMLALLYGYLMITGENAVTGTSLMKSAKISGIPIDRVDRLMSVSQPDYVLSAGVKKARRYQLNNRGISRAEEIIKAIVQ